MEHLTPSVLVHNLHLPPHSPVPLSAHSQQTTTSSSTTTSGAACTAPSAGCSHQPASANPNFGDIPPPFCHTPAVPSSDSKTGTPPVPSSASGSFRRQSLAGQPLPALNTAYQCTKSVVPIGPAKRSAWENRPVCLSCWVLSSLIVKRRYCAESRVAKQVNCAVQWSFVEISVYGRHVQALKIVLAVPRPTRMMVQEPRSCTAEPTHDTRKK